MVRGEEESSGTIDIPKLSEKLFHEFKKLKPEGNDKEMRQFIVGQDFK
jgi:hypothetical protein